jgi:serine/threonine protein kinase
MSAGPRIRELEAPRSVPGRTAPADFAGRYALRELIAEGKKAQVHTATHQPTGKIVVLKLLAPDRRRERDAARRLMRESIALRRARHPGIVQILDSGSHDGSPFIALEHLRGRSLAGLLAARGRFSVPETIELGVRLTEILGDAHVTGVVHRDLKPSHVFCVHGGGVRLIDFGSARVPEMFETSETEGITLDGVPIGSPEYMPPEALRGQADSAGRSDIYALGVLLFELLTGSVPFTGSLPEIILAQNRQPIPDLKQLRPDVPTAIRSAIERCLAMDLADRYASMADLNVDLELARDFPAVSVNSRRPAPSAAGRASLPGAPPASVTQPRGAEARRFPRASYTTPALITKANGETLAGRVEEISEGGAQFASDQELPLGVTGHLKFSLPLTGKVCDVAVKVQWARAGRVNLRVMGLEFDGMQPDAALEVRQYVQLMQSNPVAITG